MSALILGDLLDHY